MNTQELFRVSCMRPSGSAGLSDRISLSCLANHRSLATFAPSGIPCSNHATLASNQPLSLKASTAAAAAVADAGKSTSRYR